MFGEEVIVVLRFYFDLLIIDNNEKRKLKLKYYKIYVEYSIP